MRNISLDIAKLSMAVMVVALHSEFLSEYSEALSYVVTNGIFRVAVPIFYNKWILLFQRCRQ